MKNTILFFLTTTLLLACVPTKKYEQQNALAQKYLAEKEDCHEELATTKQKLNETNSAIESLTTEKSQWQSQANQLQFENQKLSKQLKDAENLKASTAKRYADYMQKASQEQEALTQALAAKERKLNQREIELQAAQNNLTEREKALNEIKNQIFEKEQALTQQSDKIENLQNRLSSQKMAMDSLRQNINNALKGFASEDLTVEEKNGKIYVSLSNKLLFKPASFVLDSEGQNAIVQLASVLQKQSDIDIIVEGHTDSDPYKGAGQIIDNLDLSTKRATSVVRMLKQHQVAPEKIVASGRGETQPIASNETKEGKAKNRRIEIILAPNMQKLIELIQSK